MKRFILDSETITRNISEYKPEYAGKIYCEDCRVPIFYVPGNVKPPHFRVLSPNKHSSSCNAKSKNNKDPLKKKINYINGVPVLNLLPKDEGVEEIIGGDRIERAKRRKRKETKKTTTSIKRMYLKDIVTIGKYIKSDFENRNDLPIIEGNQEKKLFSLIFTLERFEKEKKNLAGKDVFLIAKIDRIQDTQTDYHRSIYCSDNDKKIRIFVNNTFKNKLKSTVKDGRVILVRGIYSEEYSGQIVIQKSSDIYVFPEYCQI